ncbi:MAG: hypothetical protein IPM39_10765 [Chloroflexi bacterium]|nr:hypothetical protein [Chloroflexota bacterium]
MRTRRTAVLPWSLFGRRGKVWEFGQKKSASRWLMLMAWRILARQSHESQLAGYTGWLLR